ncbi:hypothetical protein GGF43_004490 [Coemansia sp. RSA 2618]|nr:hypothetical protein GGF43_004490 [Coemansia sp. RSA 2618]
MQPPPRVVRQVRASQIVQVPSGLSAFASELVSREYRLVVVAAVAPLEPTAATDSVHTNDSARLTYQPQHARSAHNLGTTRSSSSSAASAASGASLLGGTRYSEGARYSEGTQPMRRRRRRSESGIAPQQPQWSVSERSSAIAAWTIDVVDHFDVQFDELVSPEYGSADPPAAPRSAAPLAEVEVLAGEYAFVPPSPVMSPSSTPSPERPPSQERASHHRRTSSGLVGFLMRGFRSSASSPTTSAPASSPTTSAPAAPVSMSAVSPSTRHVRSMSGADSHPRANNNRGSDKKRHK